jgi:hypothetical protein
VSLPVLILLVLLIVAVSVLVRYAMIARRDAAEEDDAVPETQEKKSYHAVSIKVSRNACRAARDMAGHRFLSNEAPRLPLPKCDASECKCRFAHHKDRRAGRDRRSPFSVSGLGGGSGNYEVDRRERKDRRKKPTDEGTT